MKRRCTLWKAASVMLAAVILGTGCRKNVDAPSEALQNETAVSASTATAYSYPLTNQYGKTIGQMRFTDDRGYARVEVVLDGSVASSPSVLSAGMIDRYGHKYAELKEFSTTAGNTLGQKNYVSLTVPLADMHGKTPAFRDFWPMVQGYSILTYDEEGQKVARGVIQ